MVKYHFITFATPSHMEFAENNVKSALTIGGFDTATIYTPKDIDIRFKNKNYNIFKQSKGYGYWIWKPYFIFKKILEIDENDILCYNDSKYIWLNNIRELEKISLTNQNIGVFTNKPNGDFHIEKQWSKFDAFALNEENYNTLKNQNQIWAGLTLFRKCFNPIVFIGEWLTYCQDERIVTDLPSRFGPNDTSFIENRHDQTILSLLIKKWQLPVFYLDKKYMLDIRNPHKI